MQLAADLDLDPRVRRTRHRLRQALLDLASERPLDDLSVSELAAAADINRATFYAHYRDRDALLLDAIDALLEQTAAGTASATADEVADPVHAPRHTVELFAELDRHAGLYRQILGPGGSAAVVSRMRARLARAIRIELERRSPVPIVGGVGPNGVHLDVQAAFLAGAILGVAADWLVSEPRRPVAEIAAATWTLSVATGTDPHALGLGTAGPAPPSRARTRDR